MIRAVFDQLIVNQLGSKEGKRQSWGPQTWGPHPLRGKETHFVVS